MLNRGNSAEPKSLDPIAVTSLNEFQIAGDLLMGLTTEDAEGRPIPGAAESWESSKDGLTWTFQLRDHLWSDGVPVTADDFVIAWRRMLDPRSAASYAYYLYPIKNARAVNSGGLPLDELGVAAIDAKTLVVTLEFPLPFMAEFVSHITLYPIPSHSFETKGTEWSRPGNYLSNGAYVLKDWAPDDHITLVKNPNFYDAANVLIEVVNYFPTPDGNAALKRLRAGELDTQDPVPPLQMDWLRANMPNALQVAPSLSLSYLTLNLRRKPLDDVRIREALTLAVDREALTDKILKSGERPAYNMVPAGIANYPGGVSMAFKDVAFEQRLAKAQALMRSAGYGPEKTLGLRFATTTNSVNRQMIAPIQEMVRKIFVTLEVAQSDPPINSQKLRSGDFDVGSANWVADYNDASNFLDLLRSGGGNNFGGYSNQDFDALLDQAARETDLLKRGQILAQAERLMQDDFPLIFLRFGTASAIVQPHVVGWIANAKQVNRSRWLRIEQR